MIHRPDMSYFESERFKKQKEDNKMKAPTLKEKSKEKDFNSELQKVELEGKKSTLE